MEDKVFLKRTAKFAKRIKKLNKTLSAKCKKKGVAEDYKENLDSLIENATVIENQVKLSAKIEDRYEFISTLNIFSDRLFKIEFCIRSFALFDLISKKLFDSLLEECKELKGYAIELPLNTPSPRKYKSLFDPR